MARRTRRHPQVLGHRRDREGAAQPSCPRPRGGQTGLTRPPALPACPLQPLPAAPPATSGPPLAVPLRAPGRGLQASARAAAHSPLSSPPPRAPHFTPLPSGELPAPGSLRPASSSRDFGPLAARDPSLPFLPFAQHWPPPGLSPRPTGQPGPPRRGRLEAGPRAPPHGGGGGATEWRQVGGARADVGSPAPPCPLVCHVTGGSLTGGWLTGFFATPSSTSSGSLSSWERRKEERRGSCGRPSLRVGY